MAGYKKLTKEQMEYIKKPIDHQQLCTEIRKNFGKTINHVRNKYTGDAKPIFVDKGSN